MQQVLAGPGILERYGEVTGSFFSHEINYRDFNRSGWLMKCSRRRKVTISAFFCFYIIACQVINF